MRKRARQLGFTLIEIVLALTVLGIIMSITYSVLTSILRAKVFLDERYDTRLIANSILNRLTRELQLATPAIPLIPDRENIDQPNPQKLNLLGESNTLSNDLDGDRITFLALEGGQYLPDGGSHSGIVQITYRAENNPDGSRGKDANFFLVREEVPYMRPFDKAYEKSMIFPISERLVSISFRYLDEENQWVSSWGKEGRVGLPRIVKFHIKIRTPLNNVEEFESMVALRSKD